MGTQIQTEVIGANSVTGDKLATTITGTQTFSGQLIGKGTVTNDSAAAGNIGEFVSSAVTTPTNFPAPSTSDGDGTSISLTAGDWDITASLCCHRAGSTVEGFHVGFSTTTGDNNTGLVIPTTQLWGIGPTGANGDTGSSMELRRRISLSGTTTYYLKVWARYTAGTPQYTCFLSARRVR